MPHGERVPQANSPIQDSQRVGKEGAGEVGSYPPGRPNSIRGRANRENNHVPESKGEEERVEVKKRPSIVISIQLD